MECQSKLLSVQDELSVTKVIKKSVQATKNSVQLNAVKDTEKMSSWAAVVEKNSSIKVSQTLKEMKKAVKSVIIESNREYNVIMFNIEEKDEDDHRENFDADTALDIMNSAGLDTVEGEYITKRIGALISSQLLLIC